jgi:signal transduction histidine kinase
VSESTEERTERLLAMGQMAASLAHEIRNPLGGMELFCSLLVKELGDEEKKKNMAEQILKGIRTVERTIQNCLQFAREIIPQKTLIPSINQYLKEMVEIVSPRAKDLGVSISLVSKEETAYFDPFLMQQTLINLLTNGVDAVHDRMRRELKEETTSTLANQVTVEVVNSNPLKITISDTGDGIKEENLTKIFDPFMTTKTTGTGLGLAICHAIVRAHGGEIKVESDKGAKFTVIIPEIKN